MIGEETEPGERIEERERGRGDERSSGARADLERDLETGERAEE